MSYPQTQFRVLILKATHTRLLISGSSLARADMEHIRSWDRMKTRGERVLYEHRKHHQGCFTWGNKVETEFKLELLQSFFSLNQTRTNAKRVMRTLGGVEFVRHQQLCEVAARGCSQAAKRCNKSCLTSAMTNTCRHIKPCQHEAQSVKILDHNRHSGNP